MAKSKSKRSSLSFALKGTNILIAGDKKKEAQGVLELVYSGGKAKVDNVTVALIELDEYEAIDPKVTGNDKTLAKFTGKIANKVFKATSSEILTDKLPDTAPYIKVSIGGTDSVKVKLPDADGENGLFELGIQVTSGKSTYRGTWRAYVRHYTIAPAEGPVLAFITGDDATAADAAHRYFGAATAYWKKHADAVLVEDGMSLEEIVAFLAKHREGYGEYGAINIVGHGSRLHAAVPIVKGGQPELRLKTLYETLGVEGAQATNAAARRAQIENASKFAYTAAQMGLGAHSRIVFCACNIGSRPDLLKAIRKYVFADGCKVYAPKYLQAYSALDLNAPDKVVAPFEYLSEDFESYAPGSDSPDQASQEAMMRPIFAAAHPKLSFDVERDSYTAEVSSGTALYTWAVRESNSYDFAANAVYTDAQIASEMQAKFDSKRTEDWTYTRWSQWKLDSITREDVTDESGQIVTTENVWVTVSGGDAVPQQSFVAPAGDLVLGSDPVIGQSPPASPEDRPGGITLPDPSIADRHARLSTTGAPRFAIRAEEAAEGAPTNTFAVNGRSYQSFNGKVPMSFSIGPYSIDLRSERERLATAHLSRTLVFWTRPLRSENVKVPYKERQLVTPDVNNSSHYGSSDDPEPSDEDLAKLFE